MNGVHPAQPSEFAQGRLANVFLTQAYPKNQWYRMVLALLRRLNCILYCEEEEDILSNEETIPTEVTTLRNPEPMAKKTIISNLSDTRAKIYEAGHLIAILDGLETRELPVQGRLLIEAEGITDAVVLSITTILRCECGFGESYEEEYTPIGSFLL